MHPSHRVWERTPRCHPLGCPRGGATLVSEQGFLARDALSDLHLEDRESCTVEESRFGSMLCCGRLRVPLERPHRSETIGPQRPGQSVPSGVEEAQEGAPENGPWSPQGDYIVKRQGNGCCAAREVGQCCERFRNVGGNLQRQGRWKGAVRKAVPERKGGMKGAQRKGEAR